MQYNRDMISIAKDNRFLSKANRNATVKMVLLLNEYHSCDQRYFPKEENRKKMKESIENELKKLNKKLPPNMAGMMHIWMKDASSWREAVDTIHI